MTKSPSHPDNPNQWVKFIRKLHTQFLPGEEVERSSLPLIIGELRAKFFTQADIAERVGLDRSTITRYEDEGKPVLPPLGYLAFLFKVWVEEVATREVEIKEQDKQDIQEMLRDILNQALQDHSYQFRNERRVYNWIDLCQRADTFITERKSKREEKNRIQQQQTSELNQPSDKAYTSYGLARRDPPSRVPFQIPAPVLYFVGRDHEINQIGTDLQVGRVVTLCGPGGIGKTAIMLAVVRRLAPSENPPEHFPDGVIYYSFYDDGRIDFCLEHIAISFGEEPTPTPEAAARRVVTARWYREGG
jgi:transcriptional regulator with XRE-family HTH domain